ncbi:MAG: ABC transporter permease [Dehalococcoidia bacterium]|nr:ABC transporter permease [Dehalococcoidia bacterium]
MTRPIDPVYGKGNRENRSSDLALGRNDPRQETIRGRNPWRLVWQRFAANRIALVCLIIIIVGLYITGIFAPLLSPYSPMDQNLSAVEKGPSLAHWLGTDELGRDLLSRIIWGARTASIVSIIAVSLSTIIGVVLGSLAGYLGGWFDTLIMRVSDILFAFPSLLFVIFIAATVKPSAVAFVEQMESSWGIRGLARSGIVDYLVVFSALSVIAWPGMARLIRGQVLSVKRMEFVSAAQSVGASTKRIVFRHILPNCLSPVLVAVSMGLGGAVMSESVLSYLGVGIQPPNASWGAMIWENREMWRIHPHLIFIPGGVVAVIIFAFNFIGDGLNDALNPRNR